MKIGITLNEVLRDFLGQLTYTYSKYYADAHGLLDFDIKEGDVTTFDLTKYFKFETTQDLNKFMYMEAPLEIFGHADQLTDGLINQFNYFLMDMEDDGEHQVELVSREADKSIPSTFFFLSKTGCRATNIRFVKNTIDKWNGVDILITANPIALQNKPEGKISVKVKASYNADVQADFEIDSILDFIKDEALREKILNTKITIYEEI